MKTVLAVGHLGPARLTGELTGLPYQEAEVVVAGPTTVHSARQIAPIPLLLTDIPGLHRNLLLDLVFEDIQTITPTTGKARP